MGEGEHDEKARKRVLRTVLVRIPEVFGEHSSQILGQCGAEGIKRLGSDFYLIQTTEPGLVKKSAASLLIRWSLFIEHSWPCHPEKMDGFIEKAAQTLVAKFGARRPQAIVVGPLDQGLGGRYYKQLASNLRGRILQVFPAVKGKRLSPEEQDPEKETLFCLVGKEGLFCGMRTPREANGFYAGGTKFIRQSGEDTISRAGAKVAEALHYLTLHRPVPAKGAKWLELGASPGGMTAELLRRGYEVMAVDRGALDPRLNGVAGLKFFRGDVADFQPKEKVLFDAILCDMNGDPLSALRQVARLSAAIKPNGVAIFTLKTTGSDGLDQLQKLVKSAVDLASKEGLKLLAKTHLTYNRQEFTFFWVKS